MGKGKAYIVVFCTITILVFGVMVHLMDQFEPPQLKKEVPRDELNPPELKFENVIFDDVLTSALDPPQYGIEKTETNNIEFFSTDPSFRSENFSSSWKHTTEQEPAIWYITHTVKREMLAMAGEKINVTTDMTPNKQTESTSSNALPELLDYAVKGHRRSVNDLRKLGDHMDLGAVILKIIDDSGQSRIEIKLSSNDSFKRKRFKDNTNLFRNKSRFSMSLQTNSKDQFKSSELAKDTIITIMPNDSVIVDEYEDYVSEENKFGNNWVEDKKVNKTEDIISKIYSFKNSTVHNITDEEKVFVIKLEQNINKTTELPIYKEMYTLNVLFDNETKPIQHLDTKNNNFDKNEILENTKKISNVSDEYITELNSNIVSTDYNNSTTIPIENSTIRNEYSIAQIVTILNEHSTTEMLKSTEETENSSIAIENKTIEIETSISEIQNSTIKTETVTDEIVNHTDEIKKTVVKKENSAVEMENSIVEKENSAIAIENSTLEMENSTVQGATSTFESENYDSIKNNNIQSEINSTIKNTLKNTEINTEKVQDVQSR